MDKNGTMKQTKKFLSLMLSSLLILNFSTRAEILLDESSFKLKKIGNNRKIVYTEDSYLKDGEFYVIDLDDLSWNGAYYFDDEGYWDSNVVVSSDDSDLIRISGGHWQQTDGKWRYGVTNRSNSNNTNNNNSQVDNNIQQDFYTNWCFEDNNSENLILAKVNNKLGFYNKNSLSGGYYSVSFADSSQEAVGNSNINTHLTTYPQGNNKIKVGIIDSSFGSHNDLIDNIKAQYDGLSGKVISNITQASQNYYQGNQALILAAQHGTHVAGIIQQVAPNVELYVVYTGRKAIANGVETYVIDDQALFKGIQWLQSQGCRVVNCSFGFETPDGYTETDSIHFVTSNMLFVCAAGNNGQSLNSLNTNGPATFSPLSTNIVSVANIRMDGNYSSSSNRDNNFVYVDVGAPGEQIYSTVCLNANDKTSYDYMTGTSMAAPYVTGAVCRMLENNPNLTNEQIKAKLKSCGKFLDFNKLN